MLRFTAEFGMESGGSKALLPPGKLLGRRPGLLPAIGSSVKNCVLRSEIFRNHRVFANTQKCVGITVSLKRALVLYDQATRAISTG